MINLPKARRRILLALVLVTLASTALACTYAIRVPFFQRPDEMGHADYAFTLFDVGHSYVTYEATPSFAPVAPQLQFLERIAAYRSMRYNHFSRAPNQYGTTSFIASLDAAAPRADRVAISRGAQMPYVMFLYPCGYYATVALVLQAAMHLSGDSLWRTFLSARLFNAGLLLITLPFAFGAFRQSGIGPRCAIVATAAIGFLPLVSWVSGYIQPDNLSFLLVTLSIYFGARIRRRGLSYGSIAALTTCLASLVFTKQHYGIAAWLPAFALIATRARRPNMRRYVAAIALISIVPAVCLTLSLKATPIAQAASVSSAAALGKQLTLGPSFARLAKDEMAGVMDEFGGGVGFDDYWFYDLRDYRVFGRMLQPLTTPLMSFVTLATMLIFLLAFANLSRRFLRIAYRRSRLVSLRLIASGLAVNCYVLTTLAVLTAYSLENRRLWLEGRYWYPIIVPLMILLLTFIPTLVRPKRRRALSGAIAVTLLGVSVCLAPISLAAVQRNFYGPRERTPDIDLLAGVIALGGVTYSGGDKAILTVVASRGFTIRGYAVDLVSGLPADWVAIELDGTWIRQISTGRQEPEAVSLYQDEALDSSGFNVWLNTAGWRPGSHTVAFAVRSNDGKLVPFPKALKVTVVTKAGDG